MKTEVTETQIVNKIHIIRKEIAVPDPLIGGQNGVLQNVINYAKGKGVNGGDIQIITVIE